MSDLATDKHGQGTQKRSEETKRRLIEAAIDAFSLQGFDGISAAALEEKAGVQRGLLAYHFGSKDELWKAAVDTLTQRVDESILRAMEVLRLVPDMTPLRAFIAVTVRTASEVPELEQIILQESKLGTSRMDYLIDNHIRPLLDKIAMLLGFQPTVFDYYLFRGVCTMIYAAPHQARRIWGIDPFTDAFISEHIRAATKLLQSREANFGQSATAEP